MIERSHPRLSVGAQCRLLTISRSSFRSAPQGETATNLDLMLLIDKPFPDTPFHGIRQTTRHLQNEGHAVNQKRIRRLMRLMRLMPIHRKPDTGRPAKGHKTCTYLPGKSMAQPGEHKSGCDRLAMRAVRELVAELAEARRSDITAHRNRLVTVASLSGLWNGSPVSRWRAGDCVAVFRGRRLSARLMAQPVAAAQLLSGPVANGQGFLARFLLTEPPGTGTADMAGPSRGPRRMPSTWLTAGIFGKTPARPFRLRCGPRCPGSARPWAPERLAPPS
jgi:hypothetical protein